jgi:hypothetical protein
MDNDDKQADLGPEAKAAQARILARLRAEQLRAQQGEYLSAETVRAEFADLRAEVSDLTERAEGLEAGRDHYRRGWMGGVDAAADEARNQLVATLGMDPDTEWSEVLARVCYYRNGGRNPHQPMTVEALQEATAKIVATHRAINARLDELDALMREDEAG